MLAPSGAARDTASNRSSECLRRVMAQDVAFTELWRAAISRTLTAELREWKQV